jgi:hypothetical protein
MKDGQEGKKIYKMEPRRKTVGCILLVCRYIFLYMYAYIVGYNIHGPSGSRAPMECDLFLCQ